MNEELLDRSEASIPPPPISPRSNGQTLAAIDLGSNSFHMVVARVSDGQLVLVDRMKEMVQLGAGLDDKRHLSNDAQTRAGDCLQRFGQRVRSLPQECVRAVGTNTLRSARDSGSFLKKAEEALGHPIEIISGIEEARLIYLGVVQGLGVSDERRLVVDIGGGSTELVVGERYTPLDLESLYTGCVAMMRTHFPDGKITQKRFREAEVSALQELERVQARFRRLGWKVAVGASGTIRAVAAVLKDYGWTKGSITRDALKRLKAAVLKAEHVDKLTLPGLSRPRLNVFPGGIAVLSAVFEALDIDEMQVSQSALREGLLNELLGRFAQRDTRSTTVDALMERYHVDRAQALRVENTLLSLIPQVAATWNLPERRATELGSWAARLHEIGLDIAHSHYHKHGAYVLENADMPGFSQQEQRLLAALVRAHRRKFPASLVRGLPTNATLIEHLAVLLRAAVLLHRSRTDVDRVQVAAGKRSLELRFPGGWLETHALTQADLDEEAALLKDADWTLKIPVPVA
jgi:exopolyphosphatase/guanosine-5'-triphosphate,3'-diphosphate pyrophosphatase